MNKSKAERNGGRAMPMAVLLVLLGATTPTRAEEPCGAYRSSELAEAFQVFRVPPLAEDPTGFRLEEPGKVTDVQRAALDEIVERALCTAHARHVSVSSLRVSVLAGTDGRGARPIWRDFLKKGGANDLQAEKIADMMVNITASFARSGILVDELRERFKQAIEKDPSLAGLDTVDPAVRPERARALAIDMVPRLIVHDADAPPPTIPLKHGEPGAGPHPRDFAVILAAEGASPRPSPEPSSPTTAPGGPIVVNIYTRSADNADAAARGHSAPASQPVLVLLQGGYLRVLGQDHLGGSLTVAWRSDFRFHSADAATSGGMLLGARLGTYVTNRTYQLAKNFSSASLPQAMIHVGVWYRASVIELRLTLLGGAVLPAAAGLLQAEPSLALQLPASFELIAAGSGGGLLSKQTSGLWSASLGVGRSF